MVLGIFNQKLWRFVKSAGNSDIVFSARDIELSETPVDNSQLFVNIIIHDVLRLDISVHDAITVRKVDW